MWYAGNWLNNTNHKQMEIFSTWWGANSWLFYQVHRSLTGNKFTQSFQCTNFNHYFHPLPCISMLFFFINSTDLKCKEDREYNRTVFSDILNIKWTEHAVCKQYIAYWISHIFRIFNMRYKITTLISIAIYCLAVCSINSTIFGWCMK